MLHTEAWRDVVHISTAEEGTNREIKRIQQEEKKGHIVQDGIAQDCWKK